MDADGSAIVFSSDRAGNFDLWRVAVGASGASAEPERLTTSPLAEGQPAVAHDGRIIFVRGRLGAAALWVAKPSGGEAQVDEGSRVEQWPAISPDGDRVAYVSIADGTRKLHVRDLVVGTRQRRAHRPARRAARVVAVGRPTVVDGDGRARLGVRHAARRPLRECRSALGTPSRRGIPTARPWRSPISRRPTRSRRSATTAIRIEPATARRISSPRRAGKLWMVDAPIAARSAARRAAGIGEDGRSRAAQRRRVRPTLDAHGGAVLLDARRGGAAGASGSRSRRSTALAPSPRRTTTSSRP